MNQEDFDQKFKEMLDTVLEKMAENSEIDVKRFYTVACILENMAIFSPVFYGIIKDTKK